MWSTLAGFVGVVSWVGAVDWHSSPPSVDTQYRLLRLTVGNGSEARPVQVPRRRSTPTTSRSIPALSNLAWWTPRLTVKPGLVTQALSGLATAVTSAWCGRRGSPLAASRAGSGTARTRWRPWRRRPLRVRRPSGAGCSPGWLAPPTEASRSMLLGYARPPASSSRRLGREVRRLKA